MSKPVSILVVGILFGACGSVTVPLIHEAGDAFTTVARTEAPPLQIGAGATPQETFNNVVAAYGRTLADAKVPGGAIAVVLDGKLAFSAGVGVKRSGAPDPVNATTLFRAASMSKMIEAAAALALVEQGKLRLDDRLTTFLPTLTRRAGFDANALTVAMALTHTSGLPDDGPVRCPLGQDVLAQYFRDHGQDPLWAPPGRLWNYSNTGYAALAGVIAAAAGKPYEDTVAELVFQPAAMQTASFDVRAAIGTDHALGHRADGTAQEWDSYDCEFIRGPGGVLASVEDYAHFAEALLAHGGAVLSASSTAAALSEQVPTGGKWGYGYGLFTGKIGDLAVIHHGGNLEDFNSFMIAVPERGFAIIAFANMAGSSASDKSWLIPAMNALLGTSLPASDVVHPDGEALKKYAGTYTDTLGHLGTFQVQWTPAGLQFVHRGSAKVALQSLTFFFDAEGGGVYAATRGGVAKRVGAAD